METKIVCIYSIKCLVNNRVYVGQTDDFNRRKIQHLESLRNNTHWIEDLQNDFNLYGENNFNIEIIEICKLNELDELERKYIKKLGAFEDDGRGYNSTTGGKSGFIYSKRHKEKLSKIIKEVCSTSEYRKKKSEIQKKLLEDPDYYEKFCQARRKVASRPEFREHLKRISSNRTPEQLKKLGESVKASWTEERRKEKSEEVKKRYENPEERKRTAEATKAGMAKLPKEKLSRRHLCEIPIEKLIELTKNTHLTQKQMVEKFGITIAMAKKIKSGKHWIYKYMKENNINI